MIVKYDIVIYNLVLLLYINEFRCINLDYIFWKEVLGNENLRLYKINGWWKIIYWYGLYIIEW